MRYTIDLRGGMFDLFDFTEAIITKLTCTAAPPYESLIEVWGIDIIPPHLFPQNQSLLKQFPQLLDKGITIAGYSQIVFNNLTGLHFDLALYQDINDPSFLKDENGNEIHQIVTRGIAITSQEEGDYEWYCVNTHPFGHAILKVLSDSPTFLIYDDADFRTISIAERKEAFFEITQKETT